MSTNQDKQQASITQHHDMDERNSWPWPLKLLAVLFAIAFFLLVSLELISTSVQDFKLWLHLREEGVATQATVLSEREHGGRSTFIKYAFHADPSTRVETEEHVNVGIQYRYDVGDQLPIRFDPTNPEVSHIDGNYTFQAVLVIGVTGVVLALLATLIRKRLEASVS